MQRSSRAPLILSIVAVLLLVVGMTVFFTHSREFSGGAIVGFSSYQPLETLSARAPNGVVWSGTAVAGLGITVVGFLVLAGVAGFLLGRARTKRSSAQ